MPPSSESAKLSISTPLLFPSTIVTTNSDHTKSTAIPTRMNRCSVHPMRMYCSARPKRQNKAYLRNTRNNGREATKPRMSIGSAAAFRRCMKTIAVIMKTIGCRVSPRPSPSPRTSAFTGSMVQSIGNTIWLRLRYALPKSNLTAVWQRGEFRAVLLCRRNLHPDPRVE